MRYFLKISYNGAPFHGWQVQPNAISVQSTIEKALSTVLRVDTPIVGAGRTDTGVNAYQMYAHFDADLENMNRRQLLLSLNRLCGRDITIHDIIDVPAGAHARFDATSRTYKYFITFEKSSFLYPFTWQSPSKLDIDSMNQAAQILLETSDFTSFAKLHTDVKTNICKVSHAEFTLDPNSRMLVFTITADRFLRNMVRAVVGTLVDVGRGKLSLQGFQDIIVAKDRCCAGTSMPPQALFLWKVEYPYIK